MDISKNFKTKEMKKTLTIFAALVTTIVLAQQTQENDSILVTDLDEVVVVGGGVIDLAADRVTPVAANTITAEDLAAFGIGNVEIGESLKMVPGIYFASNAGFGDAEMFLRGFGMENTALMVNGQPVNSVEDGLVYWSNWSGMADVSQGIEVQRGLGASKLAISSVGGTINIITKTTEAKKGGFFRTMAGSNGYFKNTFSYNTGLKDNGLSFSMLIDHWQADKKFRKWTKGQGQTYFFSVGYVKGNHNANLMLTGAPQWHNQSWSESAGRYEQYGIDYNGRGGTLNGEEYTERRNFYHKPVLNLSWDWDISNEMTLSTVGYASWGRGGGTGDFGNDDIFDDARQENGDIDFDAIVAVNQSNMDADGYINSFRDAYMIRGSMNIHDWYGTVSNLTIEKGKITYNVGFDWRTYNGLHFRQVVDFLGVNGYRDNFRWDNRPDDYLISKTYPADPWAAMFGDYAPEDQRLIYDHEETINYFGGFGQAEYADDNFSAFIQVALNSQDMQRIGRNTGYGDGLGTNEKKKFDGHSYKAGFSYTFSDDHQVFFNGGFNSRQPWYASMFSDDHYSGTWDVQPNQEITGLEAGYRYESNNMRVLVDLYSTRWGNRAFDYFEEAPNGDEQDYNFRGVDQLHQGIEIQMAFKAGSSTNVNLMGSFGDWIYEGDASYSLTTETSGGDRSTTSGNLTLSEVKVGRSPQTTFGISFDTKISDDFSLDMRYNYFDDHYGFINIDNVFEASIAGTGYEGEKLDGYGLMDLGVTYDFDAGSNDMRVRLNVYNLLDEVYYSTRQRWGYYYGPPRNFNLSLQYLF